MFILSNQILAQDLDSHKIYLESVQEYKRVIKYDATVEDYIQAINELYPTYDKIINMDELPSVSVQKALVKDYYNKYSYLFYDKDSKKNNLIVGLKSKEQFRDYLEILNNYLELNSSLFIDDLIKKNNKLYDDYINRNLKRLNIKKEEFEKMSEKDKETLLKIFKE